MARPSKYNPKYHIPWVKGLARSGLTVAEIADEIGVSKSTLCLWVKKDKALSDALNQGRNAADAVVEDSLYRRANGMKTVEKKTISVVGEDGKPLKVNRVETVEKELPPDVTAQIFWLKNRNPKAWRDHPEATTGGDAPIINIGIPVEKIADDER